MASFASIALSLAPLAADMVGKIMNMKKEGNTKNDLHSRIQKLENYEVEQAELIKKLVTKVEYLESRHRKLQRRSSAAIILAIISLVITSGFYFFS